MVSPPAQPKPKLLLDQVRNILRMKHYSFRTEESYVDWIRRYILFHHKTHPKDMGTDHIEAFLADLAVRGRVAASTQNQALCALLFLYREVLRQDLDRPVDALRARRSRYLPTVLTPTKVKAMIGHLSAVNRLIVQILYGSGVRLTKYLSIRVKDLNFAQPQPAIPNSGCIRKYGQIWNNRKLIFNV
jgi:integrase